MYVADKHPTKKKHKQQKLFIIEYISSEGEIKTLPLEIIQATFGLKKFEKELIKRCPDIEIYLSNDNVTEKKQTSSPKRL